MYSRMWKKPATKWQRVGQAHMEWNKVECSYVQVAPDEMGETSRQSENKSLTSNF